MCGALGNEVRIKPAGERRAPRPPPPPRPTNCHQPTLLACQFMIRGAAWASLLDLQSRGESAVWGATECDGRKLLYRCVNESYLLDHTCPRTVMNVACACQHMLNHEARSHHHQKQSTFYIRYCISVMHPFWKRHIHWSISSRNCHLHRKSRRAKPFLFCNKQPISSCSWKMTFTLQWSHCSLCQYLSDVIPVILAMDGVCTNVNCVDTVKLIPIQSNLVLHSCVKSLLKVRSGFVHIFRIVRPSDSFRFVHGWVSTLRGLGTNLDSCQQSIVDIKTLPHIILFLWTGSSEDFTYPATSSLFTSGVALWMIHVKCKPRRQSLSCSRTTATLSWWWRTELQDCIKSPISHCFDCSPSWTLLRETC